MSLLIGFFTLILVIVCMLMVLIILMQKARSDGGMGAALGGGGAAESAFGAETSNILTRATIVCSVLFFCITFGLYLVQQHRHHQTDRPSGALPTAIEGVDEEETEETTSPVRTFPQMDDETDVDLAPGETLPEVPEVPAVPPVPSDEEETLPEESESEEVDEMEPTLENGDEENEETSSNRED